MFFQSVLSAATCQTFVDTDKMSMLLSLSFSFKKKNRIMLLDFKGRIAFLTSCEKSSQTKVTKPFKQVCLATAALFLAYLPCGLKTFLNVWVLWSFRGLLRCSHHFKMLALPSHGFSGDEGDDLVLLTSVYGRVLFGNISLCMLDCLFN